MQYNVVEPNRCLHTWDLFASQRAVLPGMPNRHVEQLIWRMLMYVAPQDIIVPFLSKSRFDALPGPFLVHLEVATVRLVPQDSPARLPKILQLNVQSGTGQRMAPQHAPSAGLGEYSTSSITLGV